MNRQFCLYVFSFFITFSLTIYALLYNSHKDIFAAIPLDSDPSWYMNFHRSNTTQLLDRDVLYHHLGKSISYAKKADIIILGHSMALFGINWELIEAFEKKFKVKIYNLATAGDASGEFMLNVINKYHIHPSIWIINADDHEHSFFEKFMRHNANGDAAEVVNHSRFQAMKNTLAKNIQWKTQILLQNIIPEKFLKILYPNPDIINYRSIKTGNWLNDTWPGYNEKHNTFINIREPNCHAKEAEKLLAKEYFSKLPKGDVILTLIPYTRACRPRVQEIAAYLNIAFISLDWRNITTFDEGSHLDKAGARKITKQLLNQLQNNISFKSLIKKKL